VYLYVDAVIKISIIVEFKREVPHTEPAAMKIWNVLSE
jgi:hypothetical protein